MTPMRLTQLDPDWVTHRENAVGHDPVLDITTAQGVLFLCPHCFQKNRGEVGTHSVLVWFRNRGVPPDEPPGPGRWDVSGTNFDDLTLSPSVDLGAGEWHGFIRNGEVT